MDVPLSLERDELRLWMIPTLYPVKWNGQVNEVVQEYQTYVVIPPMFQLESHHKRVNENSATAVGQSSFFFSLAKSSTSDVPPIVRPPSTEITFQACTAGTLLPYGGGSGPLELHVRHRLEKRLNGM